VKNSKPESPGGDELKKTRGAATHDHDSPVATEPSALPAAASAAASAEATAHTLPGRVSAAAHATVDRFGALPSVVRVTIPPLWRRIVSVWYRHVRVYSRHLISNALPPFLEPLIFLVGIGLGLGQYIDSMAGLPYLQYLASGLLMTAAMYTASFECTFGTYIRLEFDHVYDGMLASPLTARNVVVGELLWAGTKGFVFTVSVLVIVSAFGVVPVGWSLLTPFVGFLAGAVFGSMGLVITSFVKSINHFNFFFTGLLSPMFFFSGVIFPVENLPRAVRPISEVLPLTHPVRVTRALALGQANDLLWFDLLYMAVFIAVVGWIAVVRLEKKLID
jgi:lipooligosaccharide transport system permease protein